MTLPKNNIEAEAILFPHGYRRGAQAVEQDAIKGGHDSVKFKGTDDGFGRANDQYYVFKPETIAIIRKYMAAGMTFAAAKSAAQDGTIDRDR